MSYLPETLWQRILVLAAYAILILLLLHLAITCFLWCLVPLLFGYLTAIAIEKPIFRLRKHLCLPKSIATLIILVLVVLFGVALFLLIGSQLVGEIRTLYTFLTENGEAFIDALSARLSALRRLLPFSQTAGAGSDLLAVLGEKLVSLLSGFLTSIGLFLPKFFIGLLILLFSAYYFSVDMPAISAFLTTPLGESGKTTLRELRAEFISTLVGFIRAYLMLFFMTYAILAFSLSVCGFSFAFSIALLIAFVDLLPILGSGSVLIPWSVVLFLQHEPQKAICLIVIYVILTVIRQIAEPRLIGKMLGLHPLATLLTLFFGLAAYGIAGMFLLPILTIVARGMYKRHSTPDKAENMENSLRGD